MPQLTPQLICSSRTTVRRKRVLPTPGEILVANGQMVDGDQLVARISVPGPLYILKIAEGLDCSVLQAAEAIMVDEKQTVRTGERLANRKSLFGFLSADYISPVDGEVEFINRTLAHVGVRAAGSHFSLAAYLSGRIDSIETDQSVTVVGEGALVQGVFGVGGESFAECFVVQNDKLTDGSRHKIIIYRGIITATFLENCRQNQVKGVFGGSISDEVLNEFTGEDIGLAVTGREKVPFPLVVSEGFGSVEMNPVIFNILAPLSGRKATLCGITQIRAGAVRPELFIAHDLGLQVNSVDGVLTVGKKVRIVRGKQSGVFGTVTDLPHSLQKLESGSETLVAEVLLQSGQSVRVARVNLEIT